MRSPQMLPTMLRRALWPVALAAAAALVGLLLLTPTPRTSAALVYTSLASFEQAYGDPPGTDFARLRIPAIGVDAPVGESVTPDGSAMAMPQGPSDVVWYDLSQWYALGGKPGAGGNAVFSGHVDYVANVPYAGVRYEGQGVFAGLSSLAAGDEIDVDYQNATLRYFVVSNRSLDPATANWPAIFSNQVSVDTVTLVTCGGTFDYDTHDYNDRVVVQAIRVLGTAKPLPKPALGGFTYGRAGTNNPMALAAAQNFDVETVYGQDAATKQWLVYIPGAPAFVNTLVGHLDQDALVILVRRGAPAAAST
jgi:sortase (surface protein transpeptidase)